MELAIINGTYREPNLFQKKLQIQFPNNRMQIGAPLILTQRIQQNLIAQAQAAQAAGMTFATTATHQPQQTLTTAMPQGGSLIQTQSANGEQNFVHFFPLQTLDQLSGAQLFEYPQHLDPNQTAFPFLTAAPSGANISRATIASSARYQPYPSAVSRTNRT